MSHLLPWPWAAGGECAGPNESSAQPGRSRAFVVRSFCFGALAISARGLGVFRWDPFWRKKKKKAGRNWAIWIPSLAFGIKISTVMTETRSPGDGGGGGRPARAAKEDRSDGACVHPRVCVHPRICSRDLKGTSDVTALQRGRLADTPVACWALFFSAPTAPASHRTNPLSPWTWTWTHTCSVNTGGHGACISGEKTQEMLSACRSRTTASLGAQATGHAPGQADRHPKPQALE